MKHLFGITFLCLLMICITACGRNQTEASSEPAKQMDTYWTAYEWEAGEHKIENMLTSLPNEEWWVDLTLRADGTAQLRDVDHNIHMQEESYLHMKWEKEGETIYLNSSVTGELIWDGSVQGDQLSLNYYGGTLRMKQAEMPTEIGKLYCPAQMKGVWMMVSEGTLEEANPVMPGHFETMVFREVWEADSVSLVADLEQKDYYGTWMMDSFYGLEVELLDVPVYDGCGNEIWSVRIHRDESEESRYTEFTMTLLDAETMLVQKYSPWDDRFTKYIFHKTLPISSAWDLQAEELEGLFLRCTEYTDANGKISAMPSEMKDFTIFLTEDGVCQLGCQYEDMDEPIYIKGKWQMGVGGTMLLITDDSEHNFWYAGAIRGDIRYSADGGYIGETYELYIYNNGGIMKLTPDAAG